MNWFRLYAEFASDAKVQSMPEVMQRRLIMLFCLNASGELASLDDETIAFALRISDEELKETKRLFIKKGFVTSDWSITNWDKRQFKSDVSAERMRRHRASRNGNGGESVTSQDRHSDGDVTPSHAGARLRSDTDSDTEQKPPNPLKGEGGVVEKTPDPTPVQAKAPPTPSDLDLVAAKVEAMEPMGGWGSWVSRMGVMYEASWIMAAVESAAAAGNMRQQYVHGILKRYASEGGPPKPRPSSRRADPADDPIYKTDAYKPFPKLTLPPDADQSWSKTPWQQRVAAGGN